MLCNRLTLSAASVFVTEGWFIYIYFLLFQENDQNRISRAGEKISFDIIPKSSKLPGSKLVMYQMKRFIDMKQSPLSMLLTLSAWFVFSQLYS